MIEHRSITDREQWLAWRREDVTASVVAALPAFNVHPYVTPLKLFVEKRGVEFSEPENKVLRRGRWLEPAVGKAVSELRPDWKLETPNVYLRDPDLRLGATPDFFIHDDFRGLGVLQAKTVAPSVYEREWHSGEQIPFWIVLQTLTETMLAGAKFGAVAPLLVDPHNMDVAILDVPRHPAAEAKIVAAVKQFWFDVANSVEPDPDFARDAAIIKLLTPREVAGKTIDLAGDNELPELLAERALLMERIDVFESRKNAIETEVKFKLGDAESATGLNGWRLTYKSGERAGYTVAAKVLRTLRIFDKRPREGIAP